MRASLCVASGRVRDAPSLRPISSRAHPSPRSERFSCCFRQLQIPVAAAQARMLVRRLPSCQSAVEHALQTITTPSALSVSCLALASQFLSHSHSLFVCLSHFCASYFSSFFSIHPSHGLMKRRLGEQHGLFVCLNFFILILLRPWAVMFFHRGSLTAWASACAHQNNKTHFYEFIPEKFLHHGQRYYWNIGRGEKKILFSKKTSSEQGHSGVVNGNNWFICFC